MDAARVLTLVRPHLEAAWTRMPFVPRSNEPALASSMPGSRPRPEPLDLDALPSAPPAVAEALDRNRPGPMSLPEYARFLTQFHWTEEQLRSIPLSSGPRFTLDD